MAINWKVMVKKVMVKNAGEKLYNPAESPLQAWYFTQHLLVILNRSLVPG